ncbi:response regulator [Pleionea sediminis]|uniref:response regulator n=1 Tax=Pleionea sediminis TaxID=2569479 RepID=UPI001184AA9E|nr:response regulator [Pleionea sediminis]
MKSFTDLKYVYCIILVCSSCINASSLNEVIENAKNNLHSSPHIAMSLLDENEQQLNNASDQQYFDFQFLRAQLGFKVGEYDKANHIIEQMNSKLKQEKEFLSWIALMNALKKLQSQDLGGFEKILEPHLDDFKNEDRIQMHVWYLYIVGAYQVRKNEFADALKNLLSALDIALKQNNISLELAIRHQLVQLNYFTQEYQRAIKLSDEMNEIAKRLNDRFVEVQSMANKMNIYYMKAVFEFHSNPEVPVDENQAYHDYLNRSDELQKQVYALSDEIGAFRSKAWALVTLQSLHLAKDEFEKTLEASNEAIALADLHGLQYERAVSFNNAAIAYRALDQHQKSLEALKQAEEFYKATNNEQALVWILDDYAKSYEHAGDLKNAIEYYKQFHGADLALKRKTNNETVIKLQEQFAAKEKNQEIERLNQETLLNEKQLQTEKMGRWLLIVILFAIVAITMSLLLKRKKLKELLQKQADLNQELSEMSAAKQRFFTNLSHELRTALTLSIGPLKNVLVTKVVEDNEVKDAMESALENNLHMMSLVSEVFNIEQVDSKTLPIDVSHIDASTTIDACVNRFQLKLKEKSISINKDLNADDFSVYYDIGHFEKIISNLMSNAIKYSPDNSVIHIRLDRDVDYLTIEIMDEGPGMEESEIPHVFKRFYQGKRSLDKTLPGTGVGLSMVKELIELHSGDILIKNAPPKGCQVTIKIKNGNSHYSTAQMKSLSRQSTDISLQERMQESEKVYGQDRPELLKPEEREQEDSGDENNPLKEHRKVVLVVDDNENIRRLLRTILQSDYHVVDAENGVRALELAKSIQPDLIIADVMMPEMDGYQLTRELRDDQQLAHLSIMLLTALSDTPDTIRGLELGADDYLSKPFDNDELKARVKSHLAHKQRLSEVLFEKYKNNIEQRISTHGLEGQENKRCKKLEAVISDNLSCWEFDVEQMYKALNMTRSTLFRYTKRMYGCSPKSLLKKRRLETAYQMLQSKQGTISEIAYAVGFQSLSTFSRAFREQYDIPPTKVQRA